MEKSEILEMLNQNPVFHLATVENGEPRVRGMLLYKADETGVYFHTGPFKDLYRQLLADPKVQLCFQDQSTGAQIRVRGKAERLDDRRLKEEIAAHPSRTFVQGWREGRTEEEFYDMLAVFCIKDGLANVWTFADNFAPKKDIQI